MFSSFWTFPLLIDIVLKTLGWIPVIDIEQVSILPIESEEYMLIKLFYGFVEGGISIVIVNEFVYCIL